MEALIKNGVEVIYSYEPLDDVVFQNVAKYGNKQFISVETSGVDAGAMADIPAEDAEQVATMSAWVQETLGEAKVAAVVNSTRLVSHPVRQKNQCIYLTPPQNELEDTDGELRLSGRKAALLPFFYKLTYAQY